MLQRGDKLGEWVVESVLDPVDDGLWVRLRGSIGGLGAGICQMFPLVSGSDGASLAQGVQQLGALAHPSIAPVLGSGRGAAGDFFKRSRVVWHLFVEVGAIREAREPSSWSA